MYMVHIPHFAWTKFPVLFSVFNRESFWEGEFFSCVSTGRFKGTSTFWCCSYFFISLIILVMCSCVIVYALLLPCFKQWEMMATVTIIKSKTSFLISECFIPACKGSLWVFCATAYWGWIILPLLTRNSVFEREHAALHVHRV